MANLGWILALPALLLVVGFLFVVQYKLATKERRGMVFIIPSIILALFLVCATAATLTSQQYIVGIGLEEMDGHGNILKMTIQLPRKGNTVTQFSDLMVYDKQGVLLDMLSLDYKDGEPENIESNMAYDRYIQEILNNVELEGIKLDGYSVEEEMVTAGVPFLGMTISGNPIFAFAFLFGIPFLLILFAGILSRFMNRKKIQSRALAKIDIHSLENVGEAES